MRERAFLTGNGHIDALISALRRMGYHPLGYIGRFMDRRCLSVSVAEQQNQYAMLLKLGTELGMEEFVTLGSAATSICADSMGFGAVIYWPDIPWSDEHEQITNTPEKVE